MASSKSNSSISKIRNSRLEIEKNEVNNKSNTKGIRIVENLVLIWLDSNMKETSNEYCDSIDRLQRFVNTIVLVSDQVEYDDLIKYIKDEKIFVIISNNFGLDLVSDMERTSQIHSVYVYCDQKEYYEKRTKNFRKVKGVFTDIAPICDALRRDIRQANCDLIPISILSSTNSDEFDQLFIYSLILKDVLINSEFNQQTGREFLRFCRLQYADNSHEFNIITSYGKKYKELSPIKWYTRECFIYSMLNRALRLYDMEILNRIIFFVQDLHQQIIKIHSESNEQQQLTVYHGQGISNDQVLSFQKNVDSLISFNTFLITTIDEKISLNFAQQSRHNPDLIGVIFKIKIDRSLTSYPFVLLDGLDYYNDTDRYVLFSLNSIFLIKSTKQLQDRLWQVDLILAKEDDKKIKTVTKWIETKFDGLDGFLRLSQMMINMDKGDNAEKLYEILIESTPEKDAEKLAYIHRKLGKINNEKNKLDVALDHYSKSYEIQTTYNSENDLCFCHIYAGIGAVQQKQGLFNKALKSFLVSFDRNKHAPQPDPPLMAFCLFNIGLIFRGQGKYNEAREKFEHALRLLQDSPSPDDDLSAKIHSNLDILLEDLGQHSHALGSVLKTLEIESNIVEPYYDQIKMCEDHINELYQHIGDE